MTDSQTTMQNASATPRNQPAVYTMDDLERIERSITTAPVPERPLSTADAVTALAPALSKARDRGHSLASLVQVCQQQGLHVTERAVGRAISAVRARKPAKKRTATGTPSAT